MSVDILVVDDFKEAVNNINKFLEFNYQNKIMLDSTDNPFIALNKIVSRKPDIVILDHQMPRLDGSSLIERARNIHKPKTILVSNLYDHCNNFDYFVPKPVDFDKLGTVLDKLLSDIALSRFKRIEVLLREKKLKFKDIQLLRKTLVDLSDLIIDESATNKSLHEAIANLTNQQPGSVRNHYRRIRNVLGFFGKDIQLARYIMELQDELENERKNK